MEMSKPYATAVVAGILTHQGFFKRVEIDPHPLLVFVISLLCIFGAKHILATQYANLPPFILLLGIFLWSLFTSILVYRGFFHPLKNFPGPFSAKFTKIWALSQAAKTGLKWYQVDAELHRTYGDYVRTGPRELSITAPDAMPFIYGFSSTTSKGPFYDSMEDSVNTNRDKEFHKQRRKIWDSSMKKLIGNYGPQLERFTDIFLEHLRNNLGTSLIINELSHRYSCDVMTQLAYGEASGFLDETASDSAIATFSGLQDAIDAIGLLSQVPWIMTLLTTFAFLPGPMRAFNDWSQQALERRKKNGSKTPDLMGHLIAATPDTKKGNTLLFADSRVIIGAGTDTTATALSVLFILLASKPSHIAKLREEIDPLFQTSPPKFSCTASLPVLDSIINETLRLHPPVLFGSQRVTPIEGVEIGSTYIPGDIVVYMPQYQLHRDPRNFVRPGEFIPERWTTRPELILNRGAFMPFSMGMTNCPGRPLAYMELRSVIARSLYQFDVQSPEGRKLEEGFFREIKDHFVAGVPRCQLVFKNRK